VVTGEAPTSGRAWVDDRGMLMWRGFLRAHAQVMRRLEADLQDHHAMALATYDVLVQLAEAPRNRLGMTELADAVLLSRSGLTRLVDRLERDHLVERLIDPDDGRRTFAVLTTAGRDRLREASATHLRGVADQVLARYTPAELALLTELLGRLTTPEDPPDLPDAACGR
jgi:DNA-binding MarR family transcriptional regulator